MRLVNIGQRACTSGHDLERQKKGDEFHIDPVDGLSILADAEPMALKARKTMNMATFTERAQHTLPATVIKNEIKYILRRPSLCVSVLDVHHEESNQTRHRMCPIRVASLLSVSPHHAVQALTKTAVKKV